jgi:hypothetical protein
LNQKESTTKPEFGKSVIGWYVPTVLGLALFFSGSIWNELWTRFLDSMLSGVPRSMLYNIILLCLTLLLFALSWILYHRPKNLINRFVFDKRSGISKHKKSGKYYCTSCLLTTQIQSQLIERPDGWYCQVSSCSKRYPNPDYRPPKKQLNIRVDI